MNNSILPHYAYPFKDEFAASFLLRTSYINGYQNPKMMLNSFGIPVYKSTLESIFCNEEKFLYVLEKLGLPNQFSFIVLEKKPPTNQFFYLLKNKSVSKRLIDINLNNFCPECLKKLKYWKKEWLLKPMYLCPTHKIKMFNNCPKCNLPLILNRTSLFLCSNCNFDLRDTNQEKVDTNEEKICEWFSRILNNDLFNNEYLIIWEALQKYYNNLKITALNSTLSEMCYLFIEDKNKFIKKMINTINSNINFLHPKIQMLPFLKINGILKDIAYQILKKIKMPNKTSKKLILRNLKKYEISLVLEIQPCILNNPNPV